MQKLSEKDIDDFVNGKIPLVPAEGGGFTTEKRARQRQFDKETRVNRPEDKDNET